jgi:uncharacterized Zn-binding protein involved in type VI secretion
MTRVRPVKYPGSPTAAAISVPGPLPSVNGKVVERGPSSAADRVAAANVAYFFFSAFVV